MMNADVAQSSGSELRVSVGAPATGDFDGTRIEQAVTNCVLNAVKFGAGKPVELSLDVVDGLAQIRVRDSGIGIPPNMHSRIFERFVRADSARSYGGFGLGLWIARQIVEASGGTIPVTSSPGAGATFQLDLPLTPRQPHVNGVQTNLS